MQPVLVVDVYTVADVLQDVKDASGGIVTGFHNGMQSEWGMVDVGVGFHVIEQVETELVQPEIHNRDPTAHLFNIDHLIHQPPELLLAVFQIAFLLLADGIVVARGGHHRDLHACFHPCFQVDVIIEREVGPEVDQLDHLVAASDAVDPPETLDDAHRVPVDVVVDQVVTVLQVLSLGNTVGGYQEIDHVMISRHHQLFLLGDWREAGEHGVHVVPQTGTGGTAFHGAGNQCSVEAVLLFYVGADMFVEVFRCVGESGKDQNLPVVPVDRLFQLIVDNREQGL